MEFDKPITIALILFVILLLIFFLVVPKYKALRNLELDLAQKQAEYQAQFDYYSEVDKSYREIKDKKDEIQKIDDALPPKPDFGQVVYYFQERARESGLLFKTFTLSQSPGTNMRSIVFSLSLSGSYTSLGKFMASLENSARLFEISRISFGSAVQQQVEGSKVKAPVGEPVFNFSLEVKTQSY